MGSAHGKAGRTTAHDAEISRPWRGHTAPALLLAALTFLLFSPAADYRFVYFDDDQYVFENPLLTEDGGLERAWTAFYASYYVPVLWMSYMADHAIHGMDPAGYHLTNILFHAVNAALACWLLGIWLKSPWAAFLAVALFAWHPLRVESVAWITERKDVLSLFWILWALIAYDRHVRKPGPARMALVTLLMLAGLLTKPVAVVLPLLLMVLDAWPYQRLDGALMKRIVEKLSLWLAAAGCTIVTILAQAHAIKTLDDVPWNDRLLQAPVAYAFYLWKTVWPNDLTVLYPNIPASVTGFASSLILLAGITALVFHARKRMTGMSTGWLWFLAALLPASGILRAGPVHLADRFSYLPSIGLSLAAGVLLAACIRSAGKMAIAGIAVTTVSALGLAAGTLINLPRWQDSFSLFHDAITKAPHPVAHYNLGNLYIMTGDTHAAVDHFTRAAELDPGRAEAHFNLGTTLLKMGKPEQAAASLQTAADLRPDHGPYQLQLGNLRFALGDEAGAMAAYESTLQTDPVQSQAMNNLAWLLATAGDSGLREGERGVELARKAVAIDPGQTAYLDTLAAALAEAGRYAEAAEVAEQSITRYRAGGQQDKMAVSLRRLERYRAGLPLEKPGGE